MLIYIPNNESRSQYLLAQSISREFGGSLRVFVPADAYEIAFNLHDDIIIVLNEFNLKDVFIGALVEDFKNKPNNKTRIVILSDQKTFHKNIFYIPINAYKPFNEYYKPQSNTDDDFILCHLDCENYKNNEKIQSILYPQNQTMRVKLVGCPNIQHIQNVGVVSDEQMLDLINSCSVFVNVSDKYLHDAVWLNKPIVSMHDNEYVEKLDTISLQDIIKAKNTPVIDHKLTTHKISNIIKYLIKL